jgi:hypothetical protein
VHPLANPGQAWREHLMTTVLEQSAHGTEPMRTGPPTVYQHEDRHAAVSHAPDDERPAGPPIKGGRSETEPFRRIVRVHCRGPRLARGYTGEAGQDMSSQPLPTGSLRWVDVNHRTLMAWRLLSAIMLLVMGGIHLYLVFDGIGGLLGGLFVLNAVGSLVLAIAIIVLRGRLLSLAMGLSLLFMVGTLLALLLALTVGLFGIHEVMSTKLVPTTLLVESVGMMILAVTFALVLRSRRVAA